MVKANEMLPVGSVVYLKNAQKKLMIIGIKQKVDGDESREFDYMGVLYPEGYLGNEGNYLFNHEDVNDVVFRGYHNPERQEFIQLLGTIFDGEDTLSITVEN